MGLKSGKLAIATAGYTVDGREIRLSWLQDVVGNYDVSKYAAVINFAHTDPDWWGDFGQVLSVNLDEKTGQLFAVIEPNERLIRASKNQTLYTSIELTPDFQKTGKHYLTGLGITSRPASVGTDQLKFSSADKTGAKGEIYSDFVSVELKFSTSDENENSVSESDASLFKQFKNLFKNVGPTSETHLTKNEGDHNMELSEADAAKIATLVFKQIDERDNANLSEQERFERDNAAKLKQYGFTKPAGGEENTGGKESDELIKLKEMVEGLTAAVNKAGLEFSVEDGDLHNQQNTDDLV